MKPASSTASFPLLGGSARNSAYRRTSRNSAKVEFARPAVAAGGCPTYGVAFASRSVWSELKRRIYSTEHGRQKITRSGSPATL